MFSRIFIACATLAVLAPSLSAAQDASAVPAQAAPPAAEATQSNVEEKKDEEVVCRRVQVAGSVIRQRVCMTASQEKRLAEESQTKYEEVRQEADRRIFEGLGPPSEGSGR